MPEVLNEIREDTPYQAFSGTDMQVYMGDKLCGSLQALTISITRETLPLFVMGSPMMRGVVRGKRAIAGTLSFTNFDRHSLLMDHFMKASRNDYLYGKSISQISPAWGGNDSLYSQFAGRNAIIGINNRIGSNTITLNGADDMLKKELDATWKLVGSRILQYSDQIPPFDICLTMVNELGAASFATVNGVYLINEGYGFTMDDLSSESAYTFIAKSVTPLTSIKQFTDAKNWNGSFLNKMRYGQVNG